MSAKTRKRRRRAPRFEAPTSPTAPSTDVLTQQNQKLRDQNDTLRAHKKALETLLTVRGHPTGRPANILIAAAQALEVAADARDPRRSRALDPTGRHTNTDSLPGEHVYLAARAEEQLIRGIRRAIDIFHQSKDHDWRPPKPPGEPKVRCRNPRCEANEKRIPKYVGPRGTRIELTNCPKCNSQLKAA